MGTKPPGSVDVNADCGAETNLAHACTEREYNLIYTIRTRTSGSLPLKFKLACLR